MTSLAQELRELGEHISAQKFAMVYKMYIISLNARKVEDLDWGSLQEEYLKRKEKSKKRSLDEAMIMRGVGGGPTHSHRNNHRGHHHNNNNSRSRPSVDGNGRAPIHRDRSNRQPPTCYRCNEVGHIARFCQLPPPVHRDVNNLEQDNIVDGFQNIVVDDVAFIAVENVVASVAVENVVDDVAFIAAGDSKVDASRNPGEWFIDSAATKHMTHLKESFVDFCKFSEPRGVALGDNACSQQLEVVLFAFRSSDLRR